MDGPEEFAVEVLDEGPPLDEECSITRDLCASLLTLDDFHRRHASSEMPLYGLSYFRDLQSRIRTAPIQVWSIVPSAFFRARRRRANTTEPMTPDEHVAFRLYERIPHLARLLDVGRGKLILAGASVARALLDDARQTENDFEFFLHHVDRAEADLILENLVSCLQPDCNTPRKITMTLTRNASSVQIVIGPENNNEGLNLNSDRIDVFRYHLKLRLFGSIQEILATMEIPPFSISFDLENGIQMTQLAGFNLATRTYIADPGNRASLYFEFQLSQLIEKGFAILLPSMKEEFLVPNERPLVHIGQQGRTRGDPILFGGKSRFENGKLVENDTMSLLVGREEDPENHRRNFGHALRRLILVKQPLKSSFSFASGGETGRLASFLNIHTICNSENDQLCDENVILFAPSLAALKSEPKAYGFDLLDEVFDCKDVYLSRVRLLFGHRAKDFCAAVFDNDVKTQTKLQNEGKLRVAELLHQSERPGLTWTSPHSSQWAFKKKEDFFSASLWYPEELYEPLVTGLPRKYAVTFQLLRLHHSGFASLPGELFDFLMRDVIIPTFAAETLCAFLEKAMPVELLSSASETETSEDVYG